MELRHILLQIRTIAVRIDGKKDHGWQSIRSNQQPKLGHDLLQIGERERTHVRTAGETGQDKRPAALELLGRERLAAVIVQREGTYRLRAVEDRPVDTRHSGARHHDGSCDDGKQYNLCTRPLHRSWSSKAFRLSVRMMFRQ